MPRAAHSREWWRATVARWKRGGLSAREFGAKEGVSHRTLTWWSSELGRGTRAKRGSAEAIVPIEIDVSRRVEPATVQRGAVHVTVGDVVVRVEEGTDVEYVSALVRALGARR